MSLLRETWSNIALQLSTQVRLRLGLLSIVGILWVYVLLLAGDWTLATRATSNQIRDSLARVLPLAKERSWPERADEARQQLMALRGMQWAETDMGLVEARLQDWIRSTAAKSGLTVRSLSVARPGGGSSEAPALPASGVSSGGAQPVSARLVVDHNRLPLLAFLSELGRNEQVLVVDRLVMRLASQPPLTEIDLRILGSTQKPKESLP